MILDSLANAAAYRTLSPRLAQAIDFVSDVSHHRLPVGRHEIDGANLFAIAMTYTTQAPADTFWEAHRRYIDLQLLISGTEAMGWAPIESMTPSAAYNTEKDFIAFVGDGQTLIVPPRHFVIFWPHDVHMPSLVVGDPATVQKIVLKVVVD